MESVYCERASFRGLNPPGVNNSKWGIPNPEKRVQEIIIIIIIKSIYTAQSR